MTEETKSDIIKHSKLLKAILDSFGLWFKKCQVIFHNHHNQQSSLMNGVKNQLEK